MIDNLSKIDVARHQLGTAINLFIQDLDSISVHCLACGGVEIIETLVKQENTEPFSTHILETQPHLDVGKLRRIQRQYWNAFKHMSQKSGAPRDDTELLNAFDDSKNDAVLFIGWWDYNALQKRLPIAVQVFQVWFYALNEEKLATGTDLKPIRSIFGDIARVNRAEQKRRLKIVVDHYSGDDGLKKHKMTENLPLSLSAILTTTAST